MEEDSQMPWISFFVLYSYSLERQIFHLILRVLLPSQGTLAIRGLFASVTVTNYNIFALRFRPQTILFFVFYSYSFGRQIFHSILRVLLPSEGIFLLNSNDKCTCAEIKKFLPSDSDLKPFYIESFCNLHLIWHWFRI